MAPSVLPQFEPPNLVTVTNPNVVTLFQNKPQLKSSSTAVENAQLLAGAVRLFSVTMTNTGASDRYLQVFDSATAAANGAIPLVSVLVTAGGVNFYDVPLGLPMTAGIYVCNSSTDEVRTVGAADCLFVIAYSLT